MKITNSQFQIHNSNRGFSLMEFVIYTALLAMVVMFLFQFLLGAVSSQSRAGNKEEVSSSAINAMNAIDFEIRHAKEIYDTTSDLTSDPGQLSLLTEKTVYPGETETYIDIFVDSSQRLCVKKENLGTHCLMSDNVVITSLDFEKIDLEDGTEDGILTTLTVEHNTSDPDRELTYSMESFTQLRNY